MQRVMLIFFGGLFVLLFAAVGLAVGVGSSSPDLPPGAVAIVEDAPPGLGMISKSELDQEIRQQSSFGSGKVPRPGDEEYELAKGQALSGLVTAVWLQGEAEEMGIEVTDDQIAGKLEEGEEAESLREANYTQRTIDERVTKELLVTAIEDSLAEGVERRLGNGVGPKELEAKRQEAFREFDHAFREQWQPRTYCADGFVTEQCGNYPAFAHSSSACYEADPKEPAEGCPAPVPQTLPALPGSVTELEPQGTQFAQRPIPPGGGEEVEGFGE